MLRCLNGGVNYVQPAAYLGVPAFVHRLRAEGYTAAGKIDEAKREAALGLAELPGDTFFPIELVPAWEKAGRKKEAARTVRAVHGRSGKALRRLSQLCVGPQLGGVDLRLLPPQPGQRPQEHALKAVALAPDNAGYLDTLAEVYFQRGDKDKAVAAQKKAIELDPKKAYFRKQLKRIEAGDPNAERPSEDEDE